MRVRAGIGRGLALAAGLVLLPPASAQAQVGIVGAEFVALGGEVSVRFLGSEAAYFNVMQWFRDGYDAVNYNGDVVDYGNSGFVQSLFFNKNYGGATAASIGDVVALSDDGGVTPYNFAYGDRVLFGLFVQNEPAGGEGPDDIRTDGSWDVQDADDFTYFSGPDSRNRDGAYHLAIFEGSGGVWQVKGGWEDIEGGGDMDFNDLLFEVSGVSVTPEPGTLILLGTGLLGLGGVGLARRRREQDDLEA